MDLPSIRETFEYIAEFYILNYIAGLIVDACSVQYIFIDICKRHNN